MSELLLSGKGEVLGCWAVVWFWEEEEDERVGREVIAAAGLE